LKGPLFEALEHGKRLTTLSNPNREFGYKKAGLNGYTSQKPDKSDLVEDRSNFDHSSVGFHVY